MKWISESYPSFMESFTFLRRSHSLQGASGIFPRAVVYGHDARLLLTFNGDPSHHGYDRVELAEFHEPEPGSVKGVTWEFRELTGNPYSSGGLKLSEPNPARCMQCHTTALHPLWDDYSIWKNAFGQNDDVIMAVPDEKREEWMKHEWTANRIEESDEYKSFLAIKGGHPRYQWLKFPEGSEVPPYNQIGFDEKDYRLRPNLRLTHLLSRLQGKFIVSRLQENACFDGQKHALLATLLECQNKNELKEELAQIHARAGEALVKKYPRKKGLRETIESNSMSPTFLELLGTEKADFSLASVPEYKYFEGTLHLSNRVTTELYRHIAQEDKKLLSYSKKLSYQYSLALEGHAPEPDELGRFPMDWDLEQKVCRHLVDVAKKNSPEPCSKVHPLPANTIPLTIRMCSSCHEDPARAGEIPWIPFSQPAQLAPPLRAEILRRIDPASERPMPPVRPLSERERAEVEQYLN